MERKHNQLIALFEKNETKFSNLVMLWRNYIKIKKENYEKNMDQCIEIFCNIENADIRSDVDIQTILFLYFFKTAINDNN